MRKAKNKSVLLTCVNSVTNCPVVLKSPNGRTVKVSGKIPTTLDIQFEFEFAQESETPGEQLQGFGEQNVEKSQLTSFSQNAKNESTTKKPEIP